jgi:cardiolipin synthase
MYYSKPGRMADEFADILIERARAGIRVLFIRDGFGSQDLPEEYLDRIEAAGVTLAVFRPARWYELHKVHHRSHIRVVVIDGQIGYTGGFGLDDKWFGDGRHEDQWRDTTVRFEGPAVLQLQATFAASWGEATGDLLTGELFFPIEETDPEGTLRAGLMHAAPTVGSTVAERYLALAIGGAQKSVDITNAYFVPTDHFLEMMEATAKRGVTVRVLTPGPNSDVKSTYYAGRLHMERLLRAGVKIYEYRPSMLHAKATLTDGVWSAVGSLNFDNRSLSFNDETVLFVHDRKFGTRMHRIFEDDLEFSEEITLAMHRARPFKRKVLERFFGSFYRIL